MNDDIVKKRIKEWHWFDALESEAKDDSVLTFKIKKKDTPAFTAYLQTLFSFPAFILHENEAEFTIYGLIELAKWKDKISEFISRFRKAKWIGLVSATFDGRSFEVTNFHLLCWHVLKRFPDINDIVYDERLPFPVVLYNKYRPFIVFAKEYNSPYFLCSCSKKSARKKRIQLGYQDNICYKCLRIIPKKQYCHPMYGPVFMQSWGYYVEQRAIENGHAYPTREDENEVRVELGYKKKGEQWENETHLFYIVKSLFSNCLVIQHYRPQWLEGLELDVWVQEEKIGFEYQGIQHYKPVEHWGGESKLIELKERDKRKKEICKKEQVLLIEVKYTENVTESLVIDKIIQAKQKEGVLWEGPRNNI